MVSLRIRKSLRSTHVREKEPTVHGARSDGGIPCTGKAVAGQPSGFHLRDVRGRWGILFA